MARKKNRQELDEILSRVVKKISKDFELDEVILFGSYAKGTATADSDIDLAVVSKGLNKSSTFSNTRYLKEKINLIEPGLQLFAFNTKVFNAEKSIEPGFIHEINKTGLRLKSF